MGFKIVVDASDLKRFRKDMDKLIDNIKQAGVDTIDEAANLMVAVARRLAPFKTGELIRGIRKDKDGKNRRIVVSRVSGPFKYNLFVNRTSPYESLKFKAGLRGIGRVSAQPFFAVPQNVVYGQPAITPSGNRVRWTGKSEFFTKAFIETRRRFPDIVQRNTKKALRVSL